MARTNTMAAALAGVVAAVGLASPARAAFPGANGKIVAATEIAECGSESEPDFFHGETWLAPLGRPAVRLSLRDAKPSFNGEAPVFSPDGKHLAYRSRRGIIVSRADGSRPRHLTRGHDDSAPAWSPGGDAVAFIRVARHGTGVYVVRTSGGGRRRLLAQRGRELAWSPRGDQLAVATAPATGSDSGEPGPILAVGLDGSATEIGHGLNISWSRTGWLAYQRDSNLYITRVAAPQEHSIVPFRVSHYAWSPDGRRLAVVTNKHLIVVDVASGRTLVLLPWAGYDPLFSPDGRLIATLNTDNRVFVTPANGGRTRVAVRVPSSLKREGAYCAEGYEYIETIDWQARPRAH